MQDHQLAAEHSALGSALAAALNPLTAATILQRATVYRSRLVPSVTFDTYNQAATCDLAFECWPAELRDLDPALQSAADVGRLAADKQAANRAEEAQRLRDEAALYELRKAGL